MAYHAPTDLTEALRILELEGAAPVAGGTDWFPSQGERIGPRALLDVTRLPGFRGITEAPQGWRIGAATRWSDLLRASLPPAFDGLKAAAREVGSVQIQNAGTVAGNLCNASPAADGVPPLLTLDARSNWSRARAAAPCRWSGSSPGCARPRCSRANWSAAIHVPPQPGGRAVRVSCKAGARRYLVISHRHGGRDLRVECGPGDRCGAGRGRGLFAGGARGCPWLEARLAGPRPGAPIAALAAAHAGGPCADLGCPRQRGIPAVRPWRN